MSAEFNFTQRTEQNCVVNQKNILTNKNMAIAVIEAYKNSMPIGVRMYISGNLLGMSYKHPKNAPGSTTADWVILDQSCDNFKKHANSMFNFFCRMARRMEREYPEQK